MARICKAGGWGLAQEGDELGLLVNWPARFPTHPYANRNVNHPAGMASRLSASAAGR